MIRNLALAGLLAISTLGSPAAAANPGCSICYWDAHHGEYGQFTHWTWECPGVEAWLCDAPAEPPPP